jgi:hypothetical protein
LREIASELDDHGKQWAVVGGLAVSARAEPRTTRDVDVVVKVEDDFEAERLIYELKRSGYGVVAQVEQTLQGRLATARLQPAGKGPRSPLVDVLFASSGIEPEIADAAESLEIASGVRAPIATTGHLIALKVLARDDRRRPQDWDDLAALIGVASPADLESARAALKLIANRGFNRGKDLGKSLDDALAALAG